MDRRQVLKAIFATVVGAAILPSAAEARRGRGGGGGRRASPNSVSGSRRRSRRRTRRRRRRIYRGLRLASLPYGCSVTRLRSGVTYYYCGSIWYRPVYQGTTIIYIVDDIESGADVDVEFEEDVYE
jgi:hypothetical protein